MIKPYLLLVKLDIYLYILHLDKLVETMIYQIQYSNHKIFIGKPCLYIIYKYIDLFNYCYKRLITIDHVKIYCF